jgi:hypothetical protein
LGGTSRCFLGEVPFHMQRNQLLVSKKQKNVIYYLGHNFYGKGELYQDFQQVQI